MVRSHASSAPDPVGHERQGTNSMPPGVAAPEQREPEIVKDVDPGSAGSPAVLPPPADPPDPPKTAASGSQWEIIYEVRREGEVKEVGVNVTATSEAEAFDLASKAVEALGNEDQPVTWRYTGRFRKVAA